VLGVRTTSGQKKINDLFEVSEGLLGVLKEGRVPGDHIDQVVAGATGKFLYGLPVQKIRGEITGVPPLVVNAQKLSSHIKGVRQGYQSAEVRTQSTQIVQTEGIPYVKPPQKSE